MIGSYQFLARARAVIMKKIDPRRLEEVEHRYLNAHPVHRIEIELSAQYGVTRRMVRKYLRIVRERLAEAAKKVSAEERMARIESMLLRAYDVAERGSPVTGSDAKAMVQAAKALADVEGLTAPKKFEVSATVTTLDGDELLREIRAARRGGRTRTGGVQPAANRSEGSDPEPLGGVQTAE